jgi:hypothetical protein
MHPFLAGQLADQRVAGQQAEAAQHRRAAAAAVGRHVAVRRRAGWLLIQAGLRLVLSPAERGPAA